MTTPLANGKYVFHILQNQHDYVDNNNGLRVIISDLDYFLTENACSDWHIDGMAVLPDFMFEESEGDFSTEEDEQTTRQELLNLGFIERQDFTDFLIECFKECN